MTSAKKCSMNIQPMLNQCSNNVQSRFDQCSTRAQPMFNQLSFNDKSTTRFRSKWYLRNTILNLRVDHAYTWISFYANSRLRVNAFTRIIRTPRPFTRSCPSKRQTDFGNQQGAHTSDSVGEPGSRVFFRTNARMYWIKENTEYYRSFTKRNRCSSLRDADSLV